MYKVAIFSESSVQDLKKEIEKLLNREDYLHNDFRELVSINYSYNREKGFYVDTIYSALVVYKT